jgi:hypothetical protein
VCVCVCARRKGRMWHLMQWPCSGRRTRAT